MESTNAKRTEPRDKSRLVDQLSWIEASTRGTCEQLDALVIAVLALLPSTSDVLFRNPALESSTTDSKELREARNNFATNIKAVRSIMVGIQVQANQLDSDVDCALSSICEQLEVLTPQKERRLLEVSKLSMSH